MLDKTNGKDIDVDMHFCPQWCQPVCWIIHNTKCMYLIFAGPSGVSFFVAKMFLFFSSVVVDRPCFKRVQTLHLVNLFSWKEFQRVK